MFTAAAGRRGPRWALMLTALLCATLAVHPASELLPRLPAEAETLGQRLTAQLDAKGCSPSRACSARCERSTRAST